MTKTELEQRIALIIREIEQNKANLVKLEGHMAEAQHWITEIVKAEAALNQPVENTETLSTEHAENVEANIEGSEQAA